MLKGIGWTAWPSAFVSPFDLETHFIAEHAMWVHPSLCSPPTHSGVSQKPAKRRFGERSKVVRLVQVSHTLRCWRKRLGSASVCGTVVRPLPLEGMPFGHDPRQMALCSGMSWDRCWPVSGAVRQKHQSAGSTLSLSYTSGEILPERHLACRPFTLNLIS